MSLPQKLEEIKRYGDGLPESVVELIDVLQQTAYASLELMAILLEAVVIINYKGGKVIFRKVRDFFVGQPNSNQEEK
jgi:hypothetical protein